MADSNACGLKPLDKGLIPFFSLGASSVNTYIKE